MDQAYYTNYEIWPHLTVAEVRRSHIIAISASSTNEILDLCINWKLELTLLSEVVPLKFVQRKDSSCRTSVHWDTRRGVLLLRGFQVPLIRFLWRLYTRVDDGAIAQVSTTRWSGGAHRRLVLGLLRHDLFNQLGPANNSMDLTFKKKSTTLLASAHWGNGRGPCGLVAHHLNIQELLFTCEK